ncbi:MAG: efflux RND transporter periplasmic adaptor subunit [Candidatus Obscuribacterales bacterium]|nr:efflux RND transporter periplasmic adaptor subunit [Candidatus Obscuribacterales bacterium]
MNEEKLTLQTSEAEESPMLSKRREAAVAKPEVKPKKKRKRVAVFTILTLLAVLGGGGYWYYLSQQEQIPANVSKNTAIVKTGSVDFKVSATGVIRPVNQVKISPKFTGLLRKLYVKQGDFVKKGQLIAVMDDSNLKGQFQAASGAAKVAEANFEKSLHGSRPQEIADLQAQHVKAQGLVRYATLSLSRVSADLKAAQASLRRDETNAGRLSMLGKAGAVSDQEALNAATVADVARANLEKVQQDFKQAEAALAQAKADLDSVKNRLSMSREGFRREDIKASQSALLQAQGNLAFLQSQMNDMRIVAPFDGTITQKFTDEGAIVTPTTSSATLSATSSSIVSLAGELELVASVSETDLQNIHKGQAVTLSANAYPDKKFHGKVTLIAPEAVVTQNVTSFEVHTSIDDDPQHHLMSGMNINADFDCGKKDGCLLVPTVCVVSKHGKSGVYVPKKDGSPRFKPIAIGQSTGSNTVITSGLKEGDKVFLGLSKDQLIEEGYAEDPNDKSSGGRGGRGGGMGGGKNSAPIPRGFGKKM